MTELRLPNLIRGKTVVFITVKNKDYIRVTQIKRLLEKEAASFEIYSSEKGNPLTRALDLNRKLKKLDISGFDVVILGFLPQLVIKAVMEKIHRNPELSLEDRINGENRGENQILISDMFLSLYDTVVQDRRLVRDGGFFSSKLRQLDRLVLDESDLVLTDTKANAHFLSSFYGASEDAIQAIYLEADPELYDLVKNSVYREEVDVDKVVAEISALGRPQDQNDEEGDTDVPAFNVLYFGTGLPLQGTDIVLDAFNMVTGDKPIKCTYIGSLKHAPNFTVRDASINPDVELIEWLPQRLLARKIAASDLCIAGHFNLYIGKADRTIPGKAYIYEAMKKPMILGDTRANRELFSPDEKHIFVRRGDAKELSDAIRQNYELWKKTTRHR